LLGFRLVFASKVATARSSHLVTLRFISKPIENPRQLDALRLSREPRHASHNA
jgi:hypothetical protein